MRIATIEELRTLSQESERVECYIALQGGGRSSKIVWFDEMREGIPVYEILNEIDDSRQLLTEPELWTESNIGQALDYGALFLAPM